MDFGPRDRDRFDRSSVATDGDGNARALLAAEFRAGLLHREPLGRFAVDCGDQVVLLDARFVGRSVGNHVFDQNVFRLVVDLNDDPRSAEIAPVEILIQGGELFGSEENGVAVFDRSQHSVECDVCELVQVELRMRLPGCDLDLPVDRPGVGTGGIVRFHRGQRGVRNAGGSHSDEQLGAHRVEHRLRVDPLIVVARQVRVGACDLARIGGRDVRFDGRNGGRRRGCRKCDERRGKQAADRESKKAFHVFRCEMEWMWALAATSCLSAGVSISDGSGD